jgi:hypothetical protein
MSTTGREAPKTAAPGDIATALADAGFVRLTASANGVSLAAAGLIGRALADSETPFQASVTSPFDPDACATDADCHLTICQPATAGDVSIGSTAGAIRTALTVVEELGTTPDHALALAGAVLGDSPTETADIAAAGDMERQPGLGLPLSDAPQGLAHSTLVHAPFSGHPERAAAVLDDINHVDSGAPYGEERGRELAAAVALDVVENAALDTAASEALEALLRPYVGGPFETIAGYADVLDVLAAADPGLGLALALGREGVDATARDTWKPSAARIHDAVEAAHITGAEGVCIAKSTDELIGPVARLVAGYRSPEPETVVVGDTTAVAHSRAEADPLDRLEAATDAQGGTALSTPRGARARFEGDREAVIETVRDQQ